MSKLFSKASLLKVLDIQILVQNVQSVRAICFKHFEFLVAELECDLLYDTYKYSMDTP